LLSFVALFAAVFVEVAALTAVSVVGRTEMHHFQENSSFPIATPPYTDEFVENIISAVRINNQLTVNAINAAAENFRTLNRTIESVTEFNTSAAKAWNSYVTVQQQFLHKQ
jgi:hypothetical protein